MPSPRRTRLKNATQHPGLVAGAVKRRTTAEVKAATTAKQVAKETKKQAKKDSIHHAAAFESDAMVDEDLMDATPRPKFNADASSDVYASDNGNFQQRTYNPPEDDSTSSESSDGETTPIPMSKKRKAGPKAADKPATVAPKRRALRRTYAVANLAIEARHESGHEAEDEIDQQMQMTATQDMSPEDEDDIYVSDDNVGAKHQLPTVTEGSAAGPRRNQDNHRQNQKVVREPNVTDDRAAKNDCGPPSKRGGAKNMEVEEMKTKKKKESIRDAIEVVQDNTKSNVSRKHPSHVGNAPAAASNQIVDSGDKHRPAKSTRSVRALLFPSQPC
jgi:hypothetical protein